MPLAADGGDLQGMEFLDIGLNINGTIVLFLSHVLRLRAEIAYLLRTTLFIRRNRNRGRHS